MWSRGIRAEQTLKHQDHAAFVLVAMAFQQGLLIGCRRRRQNWCGDVVACRNLCTADQVFVGGLHRVAIAEITLQDVWYEKLRGIAAAGSGIHHFCDLFGIDPQFDGQRQNFRERRRVDIKQQLIDQLGQLPRTHIAHVQNLGCHGGESALNLCQIFCIPTNHHGQRPVLGAFLHTGNRRVEKSQAAACSRSLISSVAPYSMVLVSTTSAPGFRCCTNPAIWIEQRTIDDLCSRKASDQDIDIGKLVGLAPLLWHHFARPWQLLLVFRS